MSHSRFVYVTYIRTTPQKLWEALTTPEFMKQYWFGVTAETDWQPGSPWKLMLADGRVADTGEILEAEPAKRLVIKWRNEFRPELKAEGYTRCTMEIEQDGDIAKLSIVHEIDVADSKTIAAVSGGWPRILSNLKSLLETGAVLQQSKA
ncbi:MAG: SRPBCC family protein [Rhizomicrobium sp.]